MVISLELIGKWEKNHVVVKEVEEREICISKVLIFIPSSSPQFMGWSKIRAISSRSGYASVLGLKTVGVTTLAWRTSLEFHGRDVVRLLIVDTSKSSVLVFSVIVIGMGGVGKITRALFCLLFNEEQYFILIKMSKVIVITNVLMVVQVIFSNI